MCNATFINKNKFQIKINIVKVYLNYARFNTAQDKVNSL